MVVETILLAAEQEAKARETAAELKRERFMIAEARRVFDSLDNNHDGQLSTSEVLNGKHAFFGAGRTLLMIQLCDCAV